MTRIVVLSIIILSLVPGSASAQEEINLDTLQVDLWPEYDKPEMLVIYRIQLSEDVQLPTTLSFRREKSLRRVRPIQPLRLNLTV